MLWIFAERFFMAALRQCEKSEGCFAVFTAQPWTAAVLFKLQFSDGLLDGGASQKDVAEQFQVSRFAISRHVRHSAPLPAALDNDTDSLEARAALWRASERTSYSIRQPQTRIPVVWRRLWQPDCAVWNCKPARNSARQKLCPKRMTANSLFQ